MVRGDLQAELDTLLGEVRACTHCAADLPLGPRPVVRAHRDSAVLVIGQAPGTRVHESGVPWDDPSGKRLRQWLNVTREEFYDTSRFAIVPMGFCYPGRDKRGGDSPPRPECAPLWHGRLLEQMPNIRLTLLIGNYAQKVLPGQTRRENLDRNGPWMAGFRADVFSYAPPFSAQYAVAEEESLIRDGGRTRNA
jgi:uracil-DNA glycosylase